MRTLLYEAANVMLTRYKGSSNSRTGLSRSPSGQRCAKRESLWRAASGSSCMRCCETRQSSYWPKPAVTRQEAESSSQEERRPREGADDGADFVARGQPMTDCDFNRAALHPAYPIKCRTSTQRTQAPESVDTRKASALDPLENSIRRFKTPPQMSQTRKSRSCPYGMANGSNRPYRKFAARPRGALN